MTAEHCGSEKRVKQMKDEYHSSYESIMETLRVNRDHKQLGLDKALHIFDDQQSPIQGGNAKLLTEISVKWNAMEYGLNVNDFTTKCTESDECRFSRRILFVMDLFDEHFLKHFCRGTDTMDDDGNNNFIDIFTHCLSDYNGIALLNDLEHIRDHEGSVPSMDCEYGNNGGDCIGETMRQYRGSESDDVAKGMFEEYMDGLNLSERNLVKTASRIHSFICHEEHREESEMDIDSANTSAVDSKQTVTAGRNKEMNNKFVNEIASHESEEKIEAKRMDDLPVRLQKNGLSDPECAQFMNELLEQEYDSDAIVDDLVDYENDPFNLYDDTNLFPLLLSNLFLAKTIRNHFGSGGNDNDPLPSFSFGKQRLYQWKYFEDHVGYVKCPRYGSLKEECLKNRIYSMTMRQFSEMLYSAYTLRESAKGRAFKAGDRALFNIRHEVPIDCPLSVCYIFVLLMYCNLTDLQYKYKKIGCRERDSEQTLEELKEWNREIWYWHRFFFEATYCFGDKARPSQVFYTGLNTKLSFPTFAPVFNAPISTTVSLDIANGFGGGDGMILMMKPVSGSRDFYFNVEWLSAFAHEKERVFVKAGDLMIADIKYYARGKWQNNQRYLRAFNLFSALFSGQIISPMLRAKTKRNQKPCKVLLDLIRIYKINNNIESISSDQKSQTTLIPIYIQQLFYQLLNHFKQNQDKKYFIQSEYQLLDQSLQNELVVVQSNQTGSTLNSGLQLALLLRSLCREQDIVLMYENIWRIDKEQVDILRDSENDEWIRSDVHYFTLSEQHTVSFHFVGYGPSPGKEWGGFGFEINKTPSPLDTRMSFIVDELNVIYNNKIRDNLENGEGGNVRIFKHHMLDKVDTLTVKFALHFFPSK